jgi:hypothetical protein
VTVVDWLYTAIHNFYNIFIVKALGVPFHSHVGGYFTGGKLVNISKLQWWIVRKYCLLVGIGIFSSVYNDRASALPFH